MKVTINMTQAWIEALESAGAQFSDASVLHFGDAAAERDALNGNQALITPLNHYHLIRASGPDALDFIHNQVCNDVRLVSTEQSQLNAHCSHKGRMLFTFRIFMRGKDYYLRLPEELSTAALKRMSMFILRSQVVLADVSNDLVGIGLSQIAATELLESTLTITAPQVDQIVQKGNLSILGIPGPSTRFEIYGPPSDMASLWEKLSTQAQPVGAPVWELLDIRSGIPTVFESTQEAFIPQMTNMQLINGLSFNKGCYPGQEVVARMQYRGELKRRMYYASVDGDDCPQAGDTLFAPGAETGQWAGKVINAQPAPGGGCELLAVLHKSTVESGSFHLRDAEGPQLTLKVLPYEWEDESA